jgi:hypothetical protein
MSEPEPETTHVVGPRSSVLGQLCYLCERPFEVGDAVLDRTLNPSPDSPEAPVVIIHARCLSG